MLRCGDGGGGGGNTDVGIQGARRVDVDILRAFRCEIMRISFAGRGQVKVWKGRTVGAVGTDKLPGS